MIAFYYVKDRLSDWRWDDRIAMAKAFTFGLVFLILLGLLLLGAWLEEEWKRRKGNESTR